MTQQMENHTGSTNCYLPGVFTIQDPGRWGQLFEDAYGAMIDGEEFSGTTPSWDAMATFNNGIAAALKRGATFLWGH